MEDQERCLESSWSNINFKGQLPCTFALATIKLSTDVLLDVDKSSRRNMSNMLHNIKLNVYMFL